MVKQIPMALHHFPQGCGRRCCLEHEENRTTDCRRVVSPSVPQIKNSHLKPLATVFPLAATARVRRWMPSLVEAAFNGTRQIQAAYKLRSMSKAQRRSASVGEEYGRDTVLDLRYRPILQSRRLLSSTFNDGTTTISIAPLNDLHFLARIAS